jgi:hypothetical protein
LHPAGRRKKRDFLFPMQEMGAKIQNGGPHPLVLYWRVGGIHMIKGDGSGWLRWLLKQGRVILTPGVISWIWVIVLLRETLSYLLVPVLIDRAFLFEIPNLCSV